MITEILQLIQETHSWDPNHQNFVDHQIFF
jgi:hypothetical protein